MNEVQIIVWACIIAATILIEFFTLDFSSICFSVGGIVALILAAVNVAIEWQIAVFVIVTALALLLVRPLAQKLIINKTIPTNMDANIGKKVKLLTDVKDDRATVKLGDVIWTVICDEALKNGDTVEITGTEGNKLTVKGGK